MQWSHQGVFLLNAVLTVRAHTPASHSKKGWETFTDAAISALSARRKGLVFLLWGKFAQQKRTLIDTKKHHILAAAHPSGFSANKVREIGEAFPVAMDSPSIVLRTCLRPENI